MSPHKQPEPDTELAIKKLQEKGYDVALKRAKNGKAWIAFWSGIATIVLGLAIVWGWNVRVVAVAGIPEQIKALTAPDGPIARQQGEIDTLQMRQQEDREWKAQISQQVSDIKESLRQLVDNQRSGEFPAYANPTPKDKK